MSSTRHPKIDHGFYVYLLIDPRYSGPSESGGVFYVGKGTGKRAESHELMDGESSKVRRIAEIRAAGLLPTITYASFDGETSLSEQEAYRLEAALIWSLGSQLTNAVKGHNFNVEEHGSLQTLESAKTLELAETVRALFVWPTGIRGGRSISGDFLVPSGADAWENSRRWWGHGRLHLAALDRHIAAGRPVVLIAVSAGRRGINNIVVGLWQISGWHKDHAVDVRPHQNLVFERLDESREHNDIAALRSTYVGNQLMIDGKTLIDPNRWGYAPDGTLKLPRSSEALRSR